MENFENLRHRIFESYQFIKILSIVDTDDLKLLLIQNILLTIFAKLLSRSIVLIHRLQYYMMFSLVAL